MTSFTIVTISFNQAPYLERALSSVLSQEGVDLQYVVVDAGSTDGSQRILDRYRDEISCLVVEPDEGPADGLNKGLRRATGRYFGYLNADDELLPGALHDAAAFLDGRPELAAVVGDGAIVDQDGRRLARFRSSPVGRWSFAHGAAVVLQQASFFRTGAVREVGGFNPENRTCWDAELIVDLLVAGHRIGHVHREWGVFRHHPDSISVSGRLRESYELDRSRLAARLLGRPTRQQDVLLRALARMVKYGRDPMRVAQLITDLARGTGRG